MTDLPKVIDRRSKRLGRGYGSGKGGHTVGRGQKGQKARNSIGILFEGYKVRKSFYKRLPFLRGKNKLKAQAKPVIVNLSDLDTLPAGSFVTADLLVKNNLVNASEVRKGIKVLSNGNLTKKMTITLPVTQAAAEKIKKAGGEIVTK